MNENSAISPSRNDQWSGNTLFSSPRSGVAAWKRSSTPLPTFAGIWVMSSLRRFTAAAPVEPDCFSEVTCCMALRSGVGEVVHQGRDHPQVCRLADAVLPHGLPHTR